MRHFWPDVCYADSRPAGQDHQVPIGVRNSAGRWQVGRVAHLDPFRMRSRPVRLYGSVRDRLDPLPRRVRVSG